MTGPFAFFTTSRLGDISVERRRAGFFASALALAFCSSADSDRPVSTAAAPIAAVRIMKVRRSTPGGSSPASISVAFSGHEEDGSEKSRGSMVVSWASAAQSGIAAVGARAKLNAELKRCEKRRGDLFAESGARSESRYSRVRLTVERLARADPPHGRALNAH